MAACAVSSPSPTSSSSSSTERFAMRIVSASWIGSRTNWGPPKPHARSAGELMTEQVVTAGPDTVLREVVHLMTSRAVNRLPVVDGTRVIGIITRTDILSTLARPDDAISQEVRWRLQHDLWIDPTSVTVVTRNGVVALGGMVETRVDAELATRWAAAVAGVVDVDASGLRYHFDDRRARGFTDRLR